MHKWEFSCCLSNHCCCLSCLKTFFTLVRFCLYMARRNKTRRDKTIGGATSRNGVGNGGNGIDTCNLKSQESTVIEWHAISNMHTEAQLLENDSIARTHTIHTRTVHTAHTQSHTYALLALHLMGRTKVSRHPTVPIKTIILHVNGPPNLMWVVR